MNILAVTGPYWRWRRATRRQHAKRGTAVAKPWNGLVLVIALIAFDQLTKAQLVTPEWAWHNQPRSWVAWSLLPIALSLPFLLHHRTRLAALLFLSGTLGNVLSELRFDTIANPIQIQHGTHVIAFNVADVYIVSGVALFVAAIATLVWSLPRRQPAWDSK